MKVGFNVSPLQNGNSGRGMGNYTQNLLAELKTHDELSIKEFTVLDALSEVDLVHYPFFDLFQRTLFIKKFPTIVTIPDITPLLFPQYYPPGLKGRFRLFQQRQILKKVKRIITISEASKKDIVKYFNIDSSMVDVTYLAPHKRFSVIKDKTQLETIKQKYNLPDHFALYPGSVNWNKNLLGMAEACVRTKTHLVLVGKGFDNRSNLNHPELQSFVKFLEQYENNPFIHVVGFVSNEELVGFYNLASFLLFVTFYEGFGLPILEAQACGTPVITSSHSSSPEIAGEGALLASPYKIQEITEAIFSLQDSKAKIQLIEKGFHNASKFTWGETAQQTLKTYKKVFDATH